MRTRQRQRNARICTIQRMCTFTNAAQASHPYCADLGVPCIHIKYVATIICQATSFCKTCLSRHEQCDHFLSYLHMKMLSEAVDIVWILSTGTVRLRQCSPQKDLSQTDLVMMMLMIIYNNQLYGWYIINNICQILKKKKVLAFRNLQRLLWQQGPGRPSSTNIFI